MKLIEFETDTRVFFINPAQITHVEGHEGTDEEAYINISLTAVDREEKSVILTFRGKEATRLFKIFRLPAI